MARRLIAQVCAGLFRESGPGFWAPPRQLGVSRSSTPADWRLHPGRREVSALESGGSQTSCVLVPYFGKSLQEADLKLCTSQEAEYDLLEVGYPCVGSICVS
ncbi:unnamed protein product [Staurois parvus]|uniref:Uncharacterized protein n=1 Tax=Staurois parvus TaxID=386267 RepID=A0ABN9EQH3_9NEOB|nr:unnamed protein product [Staurois parvus]